MIFTAALSAALAFCALVTVSGAAAAARARDWGNPARWDGLAFFASAALALLALLGVFPALAGAALAAAPLLAAAASMAPAWRAAARKGGRRKATARVLAGFCRHVRDLLRNALDDARELRRVRRPAGVPGAAAPSAPRPAPSAPAPGAPAAREVPPLREDPALGPAPAAADVAAAVAEGTVEVPVPFAELASWLGGFEPENDTHQSWFIHGIAAGLVAVGDALRSHADTVVTVTGLDPSYGQAVLELADTIAGVSGDAALTDRRYHVIYGEVKRAVENGLILPHKAREFFGGAGEAAA